MTGVVFPGTSAAQHTQPRVRRPRQSQPCRSWRNGVLFLVLGSRHDQTSARPFRGLNIASAASAGPSCVAVVFLTELAGWFALFLFPSTPDIAAQGSDKPDQNLGYAGCAS